MQNSVPGGGKIIVSTLPIAPLNKFPDPSIPGGSPGRFMKKSLAALRILP